MKVMVAVLTVLGVSLLLVGLYMRNATSIRGEKVDGTRGRNAAIGAGAGALGGPIGAVVGAVAGAATGRSSTSIPHVVPAYQTWQWSLVVAIAVVMLILAALEIWRLGHPARTREGAGSS